VPSMDAVLNWLWQGSLVALAAAAALRVLGSARAWARYLVAWAALLCVFLLLLIPAGSSDTSLAMLVPVAEARVPLAMPSEWWTSGALVFGLWTLWSGLHAVRAARALVTLRRARRRCRPVPTELELRLRTWRQVRSAGRATRIVLSDDVRAAAVLGCGPPLVAVAPSVLRHLRAGDLDRLVIHEWAHVQRRDDLADMLLLAIRVTAGWHPAVWWLHRRLRLERETACDETVVAIMGGRKAYAECLAALASLRSVPTEAFAGVGVLSSPALEHRVVRILTPPRHSLRRSAWTAGIACTLLATVGVMVSGLRLVEPALAFQDGAPEARVYPAFDRLTSSIPTSSPASDSSAGTGLDAARLRRPVAARFRPVPPRQEPSRTGEPPAEASSADAVAEPDPIPPEARPATLSLPSEVPLASEPPGDLIIGAPLGAPLSAAPGASESERDADTSSPWRATADGGVAIGRGSRRAAVATAGFFTRFGKRVAGSF
jgi:beta-lactamase regulating signal transducer with metallopeptidase domain